MYSFTIREATDSDFKYLEDNLREGDRVYLEKLAPSLEEAFESADYSKILEWSGKPIAIYGVNSLYKGLGCAWFLSTPDIKHIVKSLLRWAPTQIKIMHEFYPFLFNYVSSKNKHHIRCLKLLGFHVAESWDGPLIPFMRYK